MTQKIESERVHFSLLYALLVNMQSLTAASIALQDVHFLPQKMVTLHQASTELKCLCYWSKDNFSLHFSGTSSIQDCRYSRTVTIDIGIKINLQDLLRIPRNFSKRSSEFSLIFSVQNFAGGYPPIYSCQQAYHALLEVLIMGDSCEVIASGKVLCPVRNKGIHTTFFKNTIVCNDHFLV